MPSAKKGPDEVSPQSVGKKGLPSGMPGRPSVKKGAKERSPMELTGDKPVSDAKRNQGGVNPAPLD